MNVLKICLILFVLSLCSCTGIKSLNIPILSKSQPVNLAEDEQPIVKPQKEITKPSKPNNQPKVIDNTKKESSDKQEPQAPENKVEEKPENSEVTEKPVEPAPSVNPPTNVNDTDNKNSILKPKLPAREGVLPPK